MNTVQLIAKKRDGGEFSSDEIDRLIRGYVDGSIPDYQMSALAMAICLRGMTTGETATLTERMLASGDRFEWPDGGPPRVDKHSTGGIGDKVSLLLAPMLACSGLAVPMISGRGLGTTGGTLDKLESIPGFHTDLSMERIRQVCATVGCVISGATEGLVPADRKLYALRDVTATIPSIPMITASIMCKKLAEGLNALVLDVKFGSGAFMKTADEARQLAESMVTTGRRMGVATTALLTDMNQPLGRMVGNAVEVNESVAALEGRGPDDLMEVTLALGAELLVATGRAESLPEAREELQKTIDSGAAREKFAQMVVAQGGDLDAPRLVAPPQTVTSLSAGHVTRIDAEQLGQAIIAMRGGRQQLGDPLNHSTGLEMLVRLGDPVEAGEPLVRLFAPADSLAPVAAMVREAIVLGPEPCAAPPLLWDRIEEARVYPRRQQGL